MFSPICIARVRPLNAEEKLLESRRHRGGDAASSRKRSGSTFSGRQLGCVRQQADTVLALVSDDVVQSARGETLDKVEVQLDGCYVPEAIDYRRARRPSMFGAKDGQDPALAQQEMAFRETMLPILRRALKDGIMTTVVAAGGAESGKTFTIVGTRSAPGLLPQTVTTILTSGLATRLQVSILEVYDEAVRDLLDPTPDKRVKVRLTRHRGYSAEGAKRVSIDQPADILRLVEEAQLMRSVGTDRPRTRNRNGHLWVQLFLWSSGATGGGGSSRGAAYSEIVFLDAASSQRESLRPAGAASNSSGVGNGLILPPETSILLYMSSVTRSSRVLTQCCEQLSSMQTGSSGGALDTSDLEHLPIGDATLTMMLQQCLLGKHQLVWCACVSPSPAERLVSTSTLQLAAGLRYVRYAALPKAVDPMILQAQLLTEELAAVKQQIKAMETSKQRNAAQSSAKSALLQRLVELTEELQECTMSNEDRNAKQRSLRQQRARALNKLRNTSGAVPIQSDVPRLILLPHPPTQPLPPDAELPQRVSHLWDGPNVMGTASGCSVVLTSPDPDPAALGSPPPQEAAATTSMMVDELDYFLGDAPSPPPPPQAAPTSAAGFTWDSVAAFHCIIGVTELDLELHVSMSIEDEQRVEDVHAGGRRRVVHVNGVLLQEAAPNRRLHHLDRLVVGPWAFQVILPLRWRQHQEEQDALHRKKKVRDAGVEGGGDGEHQLGALFAVLRADPHVQHILLDGHKSSGGAVQGDLIPEWASATAFSRKMKTVEHTQLVEAHDRCVGELLRVQRILKDADKDGGVAYSALKAMSADVRQLLVRRAAIHSALVVEYPAEDSCLDPITGQARLGLAGYRLDDSVAYSGANAWEEVRLGKPLDETDERSPDSDDDDGSGEPDVVEVVHPQAIGRAASAALQSSNARLMDVDEFINASGEEEGRAKGPIDVDDMFAELDAMLLNQQPPHAGHGDHPSSDVKQDSKQGAAAVGAVGGPSGASQQQGKDVQGDMSPQIADGGEGNTQVAPPAVDPLQAKRRQSVMRRKSVIVAPLAPEEEEEGDDWEAPPDDVVGDTLNASIANASTSSSSQAAEAAAANHNNVIFNVQQMEALRPLLSDVQPGQDAKDLQEALQRELTAFHDELVRCRQWQPTGPPAHLPEDQAMYQASIQLRIKRSDIPAADTQLAGRIFKLRIRRSVFHRGGFYEVDAYVTNHYLLYFNAAPGTSTAPPPGVSGGDKDAQCLGSCYLYGARLELLAVGDMKYCILITSVTPRKPTKDKNRDSAENRVVLGFATRPLQLEWLEKLRCAVIPHIPVKWAKYFGNEAPRFLLLDDEAGLFAPPDAQSVSTESVHHVDVNATAQVVAHTTRALTALRSLSISMPALDGPLPTQVTAQAMKEASKWQEAEAAKLHAKFSAAPTSSGGDHQVSSAAVRVLAPGEAFDALFQLKQDPSEDDLVLRSEATRLLCGNPGDDGGSPRAAAAVAPTTGSRQTASNFMRMGDGGGGGFDAAQSMSDQRRDPSAVVPLKQVHQYHLLKHYFKTTPQLLLGTATSVEIAEEFHLTSDMHNNRMVDGNMTSAQRDLLFAGGAWSASSEDIRLATSSDDTHFLLVDHFKGSIEFVHPSAKKATVFYGKELLHIMPSYRDPRLVLLVLFHIKPYVYAEVFPTFGDRQFFMNSLETLRPTKRLYAPWLLPLHKRAEAARGGLVECNTIIDGVGAEAVTVPRSGGGALLLPSSSPTSAAAATTAGSSKDNNGLRLEGEVRVAVSSHPTQALTVWVGCWNLGGVPFHSEEAIYHWATMHLPTSGSMEDILVFSLQGVGGLSGDDVGGHKSNQSAMPSSGLEASPTAVTPVMSIGEHICAVLRRRELNHSSYRLLKAVATDDATDDALIVIVKDYVAVHVSSVQAQLLHTPSSLHASSPPGSGLAVAIGVGRSNLCVVSVRLPAVSSSATLHVAREVAVVRQVRMHEYLASMRLGDATVDAGVFFDTMIVCGDLGESASDQFLVQDHQQPHSTTPSSSVASSALAWYGELPPAYPPTCPVVLGSRSIVSASVTSSNRPSSQQGQGATPPPKPTKSRSPVAGDATLALPSSCRQLSYSGRVLFRDTARYTASLVQSSSGKTTAAGKGRTEPTASLVPLLQQTVPTSGASAAARGSALCVAEALPVSWVGSWSFLRSTALAFEPPHAGGSIALPSSPLALLSLDEVRVSFPSAAARPPLLQQLRLYVSSRHGLVQPVHAPAAVQIVEDTKSGGVTCIFSLAPAGSQNSQPSLESVSSVCVATTTRDACLLHNEVLLISVVWGLSGSKANVAGSTKIPLRRWLDLPSTPEGPSARVESGLCLERAGRAIGEVSVKYRRV